LTQHTQYTANKAVLASKVSFVTNPRLTTEDGIVIIKGRLSSITQGQQCFLRSSLAFEREPPKRNLTDPIDRVPQIEISHAVSVSVVAQQPLITTGANGTTRLELLPRWNTISSGAALTNSNDADPEPREIKTANITVPMAYSLVHVDFSRDRFTEGVARRIAHKPQLVGARRRSNNVKPDDTSEGNGLLVVLVELRFRNGVKREDVASVLRWEQSVTA
jgi:hypothetical protein